MTITIKDKWFECSEKVVPIQKIYHRGITIFGKIEETDKGVIILFGPIEFGGNKSFWEPKQGHFTWRDVMAIYRMEI